LRAFRQEDKIVLNFPAKPLTPIKCPENLIAGLRGIRPTKVYDAGDRLLVVLERAEQVKGMQPQIELLKKLSSPGVVITAIGAIGDIGNIGAIGAIGESVDFVSRTFYPHKPNWEDAVTGASHCALVPYWSKELKKKRLHAIQVSPRGGELFCMEQQDRVLIGGRVSWTQDLS
jgi:predicted PhzF superfamily epimerase YddE/YHI9